MTGRIRSEYSERSYRSTEGKIRQVNGWKVWVNGVKYPDERTYVYSQPNDGEGRHRAEVMALNDAMHKMSRGKLKWKK
jgi:hypothetical protein